jgi:hypothetical protein
LLNQAQILLHLYSAVMLSVFVLPVYIMVTFYPRDATEPSGSELPH